MNRRKGPDYVVEDRGYGTPCWIWQGAKNNKGYGLLTIGGKNKLAHVEYYERKNGPVPCGLELDHLCSVPLCINPEHQEPVTHTENVRRGKKCKLTMETARAIRSAYAAPGNKYGRKAQLARRFGIAHQNVRVVLSGAIWKEG